MHWGLNWIHLVGWCLLRWEKFLQKELEKFRYGKYLYSVIFCSILSQLFVKLPVMSDDQVMQYQISRNKYLSPFWCNAVQFSSYNGGLFAVLGPTNVLQSFFHWKHYLHSWVLSNNFHSLDKKSIHDGHLTGCI